VAVPAAVDKELHIDGGATLAGVVLERARRGDPGILLPQGPGGGVAGIGEGGLARLLQRLVQPGPAVLGVRAEPLGQGGLGRLGDDEHALHIAGPACRVFRVVDY
jgi:hypothetical protein